MDPRGTRTLTTSRLLLRRLTLDDVDQMFENWASDPQVTPFLSWPPHANRDVTRALLTDWVAQYEDPTVHRWGATVDGVLIGTIDVVRSVESVGLAEVGYCYGRPWWGRGYATEALRAVIGELFAIGYHKVEAVHDPDNVASGRVMDKAGMVREGLRRACIRTNMGIRDSQYHGLLRSEWPADAYLMS